MNRRAFLASLIAVPAAIRYCPTSQAVPQFAPAGRLIVHFRCVDLATAKISEMRGELVTAAMWNADLLRNYQELAG